jgi:predicted DsbA family dithiol-disulfide isomerase
MSSPVKIDFVSDISCTWCAIGLKSLEAAIAAVQPEIEVEVHLQPFELNPDMPVGGQNLTEHIGQKYGSSPASWAASRESIRQRGEAVGFSFNLSDDSRIYNTFSAHRLLHWARMEGKQVELKRALLEAHLSEGQDPGDHGVLLKAVEAAGLNPETARTIISSDKYASEVRDLQKHWIREGVRAVPTVVLNGKQRVEGSLPAASYEQLIREAAASSV